MFFCGGLGVFSFGINFGNENVRLVGEVKGNSFPNWSKGLAVCAC